MRRADKEITDEKEIEAILEEAKVCRIAMCDRGEPYVVPVCFGYEDRAVYFHSAREGKKLDMLRANPRVCFEVEVDVEVRPGEVPCRSGVRYRSVIGRGRAELVEDPEEKKRGLDVIMRHYGSEFLDYSKTPAAAAAMQKTALVRIAVEEMTGKAAG